MSSPIKRIFLGREGLRPGWGITLFLLLPAFLITLSHLISTYYPALLPKGPVQMTPLLVLTSEPLIFGGLLLIAFLLSFAEKRSFSTYGLALPRALADFSKGLAWGFLMLSALILALYDTHSIAFHGLALHGPAAILRYAAAWALAFLFVGLLEEFLFRGYLQTTLTRGLSAFLPPDAAFWVSALIFSVGLFSWTHTSNGGETPWGIAAVGLAGITFAFSLFRTGTLWWAIGFHTTWDWAQSFFYGTPDSGNLALGHLLNTQPIGRALLSGATAGPEGSLLVLPTLLLTCLIIHLTLPRRIYTSP